MGTGPPPDPQEDAASRPPPQDRPHPDHGPEQAGPEQAGPEQAGPEQARSEQARSEQATGWVAPGHVLDRDAAPDPPGRGAPDDGAARSPGPPAAPAFPPPSPTATPGRVPSPPPFTLPRGRRPGLVVAVIVLAAVLTAFAGAAGGGAVWAAGTFDRYDALPPMRTLVTDTDVAPFGSAASMDCTDYPTGVRGPDRVCGWSDSATTGGGLSTETTVYRHRYLVSGAYVAREAVRDSELRSKDVVRLPDLGPGAFCGTVKDQQPYVECAFNRSNLVVALAVDPTPSGTAARKKLAAVTRRVAGRLGSH